MNGMMKTLLMTMLLAIYGASLTVDAQVMKAADLERYAKKLEAFMSEFSPIMSREIDESAIRADMAGE
jgi:hypothetical protein